MTNQSKKLEIQLFRHVEGESQNIVVGLTMFPELLTMLPELEMLPELTFDPFKKRNKIVCDIWKNNF